MKVVVPVQDGLDEEALRLHVGDDGKRRLSVPRRVLAVGLPRRRDAQWRLIVRHQVGELPQHVGRPVLRCVEPIRHVAALEETTQLDQTDGLCDAFEACSYGLGVVRTRPVVVRDDCDAAPLEVRVVLLVPLARPLGIRRRSQP